MMRNICRRGLFLRSAKGSMIAKGNTNKNIPWLSAVRRFSTNHTPVFSSSHDMYTHDIDDFHEAEDIMHRREKEKSDKEKRELEEIFQQPQIKGPVGYAIKGVTMNVYPKETANRFNTHTLQFELGFLGLYVFAFSALIYKVLFTKTPLQHEGIHLSHPHLLTFDLSNIEEREIREVFEEYFKVA